MESGTRKKIPIVTVALIVINVCIWIVLELLGDTQSAGFLAEHGAVYVSAVAYGKEYYRLVTCMFLHFGAEHLMNNMLLLGVIGNRLESVLGSVCFGFLYLLSGLCGSLLSFYMDLDETDLVVSAGASGAVFGIIGGLLAYALLNKGKVEGLTAKGIFGMAALSLYFGFSASGVDNWGHSGGILGGFLLGCILTILRKRIDFRKRNQYTRE